MAQDKRSTEKPREEVGGYPAGDTLVSELQPPPPEPAPDAKRPAATDGKKR
jgi:hypothetical protein